MREPFWIDEMLLSLSRPYGWRDGHGSLCETIPCPRCGRITALLDPTAEVMRLLEWSPYEGVSYVNWCGHKQERIPSPGLTAAASSFRFSGRRRDHAIGRRGGTRRPWAWFSALHGTADC